MTKNIIWIVIFWTLRSLADDSSAALEKKINLTIDKKAEIDLELAKADESVHDLDLLIRQKRKVILERLRALTYLKDFKWGGLLAMSDSTAFERNLKILSQLNNYDLTLFKDYKAGIRNLAQGRADLVRFKQELETVITDLQKQEIALHDKEQQRTKILAAENKKSLLLFKGLMPKPTEGPIKWNFGGHRDDQNAYAFLIRGLLFTTTSHEKIHAVGPGKVIFRDPIPYWGETLIVQHDDNYYSVYAGLDTDLKIEDRLKMNDVVGSANRNEFYFELRHFDNPINPKLWLKEKL